MRFTFFASSVAALVSCGALAACTNYPAEAAGNGGPGGGGGGGRGGRGAGGRGGAECGRGPGGSGGGQGGIGPGGSGGGQGGSGPGGSGGGEAGSGGGQGGSGGSGACSGPLQGGYGDCEALIGWVFVPSLGECALVSGCGCPFDVGCPELFRDQASCNETCRVVGGDSCEDVRDWPFSCGTPPPGDGGGAPPGGGTGGGSGVAPAWEQWVFTGQSCEPLHVCGCDPAVDPCGALHATFEECLASCDRPPPPPCPQRGSPGACSETPECRWLVPGCGGEPVEREGCYPAQDCDAVTACPDGLGCQARWADPCAFDSCDACGMEVFICAPLAPPPECTGAFVDGNGLCRYPDDGVAPPECCAPYDCDPAHVSCRSLPPLCEGGYVPSVNQFACWGPCVPEGLCGEAGGNERLCAGTGGRWNPLGCGHNWCGVPTDCDAIIPGCDCGPGQNFDAMLGCVRDPSCPAVGAGLGESCGGVDGASCAPGLTCDQSDPGFPGTCFPDGSYVCGSDADCPAGTACCYPCGIQGCENTCLAIDASGSCPMFP